LPNLTSIPYWPLIVLGAGLPVVWIPTVVWLIGADRALNVSLLRDPWAAAFAYQRPTVRTIAVIGLIVISLVWVSALVSLAMGSGGSSASSPAVARFVASVMSLFYGLATISLSSAMNRAASSADQGKL
jgi:hypothetical protein